jgi:hypothetical protein
MKIGSVRNNLLRLLCILTILVFSGCFPSGDTPAMTEDGPDNEGSEFEEAIQNRHLTINLSESVLVDAEISIPDDAMWRIFDAVLRPFSDGEITAFCELVPNSAILDENRADSDVREGYERIYHEFADGAFLNYDAGDFVYSHPAYADKFYASEISGYSLWIRRDLPKIYMKENIPGADRESAVSLVRNAAETLGLSVSARADVYALDYETMSARWDETNYRRKDGTPGEPWKEDDGVYVVVLREEVEGLPVSDIGYFDGSGQMMFVGGRIMGVVGRDGLTFFSCRGIYSVNEKNEKTEPVSFDRAVNAVKEKYANMIMTNPVEITDIRAELIPADSGKDANPIKLTPAWVFSCMQTTTETKEGEEYMITSEFPVVIDGITGAEVLVAGLL